MPLLRFWLCCTLLTALSCPAAEELLSTPAAANGEAVAYILNYNNLQPKYVLILFPGADGIVAPHLQDGKLVYQKKGNFLLRAREFWVDDDFVTVTTDSTRDTERVQRLLDDLKRRFPAAKIYLVGTSRGTNDTMALAGYLADKIAGEIHTSSMAWVATFDARRYANRHLIVHHQDDDCRVTPFSAAEASHRAYGNDFITMEGGRSVGNVCGAQAYHGYNGIEKQTVEAIKQWIRRERR